MFTWQNLGQTDVSIINFFDFYSATTTTMTTITWGHVNNTTSSMDNHEYKMDSLLLTLLLFVTILTHARALTHSQVNYSISLTISNIEAVKTPIINIKRIGLIPRNEEGKHKHMSP